MTKTVKELGMPFFENSYKHGNLNIVFDVEFPTTVNNKDKELYENLLKNQSKRNINIENISNTYFMTDFSARDANTSERGGKAPQQQEEESHSGGENVKCNAQ
jgi:DnaJ-class molecular chaperone